MRTAPTLSATFCDDPDDLPTTVSSHSIEIDDFETDSMTEKWRSEQERRRREDELAAKFRALPAEPRTGVSIAFSMPNGSRIKRTFEPNVTGELIYIWVAGSTIGWERQLELGTFELEVPLGMKRVEKNRTLAEQGISGRMVLAVSQL
jgi:hypothetical protein